MICWARSLGVSASASKRRDKEYQRVPVAPEKSTNAHLTIFPHWLCAFLEDLVSSVLWLSPEDRHPDNATMVAVALMPQSLVHGFGR